MGKTTPNNDLPKLATAKPPDALTTKCRLLLARLQDETAPAARRIKAADRLIDLLGLEGAIGRMSEAERQRFFEQVEDYRRNPPA